jgi:hypothetical protein
VTETLPVTGYDLTDVTCTGDDTPDTDDNATAVIDLDPGENITCTFTNTARGRIIVEKQTNPNGAPGNFTFTGDAAGTISDNGQIVVSNLLHRRSRRGQSRARRDGSLQRER